MKTRCHSSAIRIRTKITSFVASILKSRTMFRVAQGDDAHVADTSLSHAVASIVYRGAAKHPGRHPPFHNHCVHTVTISPVLSAPTVLSLCLVVIRHSQR